MKKFLLIAVLPVLLAGTSHAQLSMRLDSIRVSVYRQLLLKTNGAGLVPDSTANAAVNRAIQRVCDDFPAIEKIDTIALSSDSVGIALNSDFLRVRWVFLNATNKWFPLTPVTMEQHRELFKIVGGKSGATFRPADTLAAPYYWTLGDRIFTYPKYTAGPHTSLIVGYMAEDSTLNADGSTCQIKAEFREAIVEYACAIILEMQGMFEDASIYLGKYGSRLRGVSSE